MKSGILDCVASSDLQLGILKFLPVRDLLNSCQVSKRLYQVVNPCHTSPKNLEVGRRAENEKRNSSRVKVGGWQDIISIVRVRNGTNRQILSQQVQLPTDDIVVTTDGLPYFYNSNVIHFYRVKELLQGFVPENTEFEAWVEDEGGRIIVKMTEKKRHLEFHPNPEVSYCLKFRFPTSVDYKLMMRLLSIKKLKKIPVFGEFDVVFYGLGSRDCLAFRES